MIHYSEETNWSERLSSYLIRWRWMLAILGIVIAVVAIPVAAELDFDRRVESLFPVDDPDLLAYQRLQQIFGGKSVVLLVYHDPTLASRDGIQRNRQITKSIGEISGVADVLSVSRLSDAMDRLRPSFTDSGVPNLFRENETVARGFASLFDNYTHSSDRTRAAVVILLDGDAKEETLNGIRRLRDRLESGHFTFQPQTDDTVRDPTRNGGANCFEAVLVGESVMISDALHLLKRDGARLAGLTAVLLSLVLLITVGDLRLVLLAGLCVGWAVKVTQALLVILGWQLSIASAVLTAIVTVIMVTSVLHLGVPYRRFRKRGVSHAESAAKAIRAIATPILWTGLTDAAGFAALAISTLAPISQFGWMVAISVCAGLIALCLFLGLCLAQPLLTPSWFTRLDSCSFALPMIRRGMNAYDQYRNQTQKALRRTVVRLVSFSVNRRLVMGGVMLCMLGLALVGVPRLESEKSFLNNFQSTSTISKSYQTVEQHFGGAGVWDVMLDAPLHLTEEYLQQVRELEERLRQIDVNGARLTKVLSIADAEWVVRQSRFAALLPVEPRLTFMSVALPGFFDALLSQPVDGQRYLRLMLRSRENLEPSQKDALIREVRRVVTDHRETEIADSSVIKKPFGQVTGYYLLLSRLIDQVLRDQWRCLMGSVVIVGLLLCLFFRSVPLALVSLVPNVLPIVTVLAWCGLSGERLNMGAAMIAAVSIGISIDGSVHLLYQYQRRRRLLKSGVMVAMQLSAGRIGLPVTLATLALVIGFGVLSASEFVPTATFGFLIAVTLSLGTLANLTLLPALLRFVDRD